MEEIGAVVEDPTELALIDELLGERDGGHAAVVIPNHVGDPGGFDRGDHGVAFTGIHRERLFAHHDFAGLGSGHGDLTVHIVRGGDVDEVDVIAFD